MDAKEYIQKNYPYTDVRLARSVAPLMEEYHQSKTPTVEEILFVIHPYIPSELQSEAVQAIRALLNTKEK